MSLAFIPYGCYWSTPFAKWNGAFAHLHALDFAAHTARGFLAGRGIDGGAIDLGVLGMTVPQRGCFYGAPWLMGRIGLAHVGGPTIMQACATSARSIQLAAREVAQGRTRAALVVTADRVSRGPILVHPDPQAPGGGGYAENWVMDNFGKDPFAGVDMLTTAENVARRHGVSTAEQHDTVLRRYEQYCDALAGDRAFQRRYMTLPFEVPDARLRGTAAVIEGDQGVAPSTREGLDRLKPVRPDGTITYGGQTHPADGNAGMIVTSRECAREMSRDPGIEVSILGFGMARTELAHMPMAVVPAAREALADAGIGIADVAAVKSHNPFVVADLVFSRETGFPLEAMNNYGCSLIYGHPQGPTGMRLIVELIEELALRGGGIGLFQGCAAGDTAMALVVRVDRA